MPVTLDRGEAERLVHAYSDLILRLSYTYLKSTDDAQDICQTVFLKLLQKPQAFSSPEHEKAWIIRTAVNLCKDHLKSGWRRATVALDAAEAVPAPAEEEGSLLSAVNLLPPKYRTVIYLYYSALDCLCKDVQKCSHNNRRDSRDPNEAAHKQWDDGSQMEKEKYRGHKK